MAAVLAGGDGAVASHRASAALHGFVHWDDRRVDVTAPVTAGRSRPGIRFHRSRTLDRRDVTRVDGIPTTTAARALLEIAPQLSDRRLKRAVRQAQAEKAANVRQIADVLRRADGHKATRRLTAIIATGAAPTASGDEDSSSTSSSTRASRTPTSTRAWTSAARATTRTCAGPRRG